MIYCVTFNCVILHILNRLLLSFVTVQGHVSSCQKEFYAIWPKRTSEQLVIHEKKYYSLLKGSVVHKTIACCWDRFLVIIYSCALECEIKKKSGKRLCERQWLGEKKTLPWFSKLNATFAWNYISLVRLWKCHFHIFSGFILQPRAKPI